MSTSTALIVGNGPPPTKDLFLQLADQHELLLCADGGANFAVSCGRLPDWVVGDLDSVETGVQVQIPAKHLVRIDDDDTGTDLHKVLNHALGLGVDNAVLTGVTGGRTDHTLWNLGLLKTYQSRFELRVVDNFNEIRLIRENIRFSARPGLKLSLCPLSDLVSGITTKGLRFPLHEEVLGNGVRDGISNEVVEEAAEIWVAQGDLLLCIQRKEGNADIEIFT